MISILELYPKYLQHDYVACHETNEVSSLINLSSYLSAVGSGEKEFYQKIFSTQMFIEFMFKRMMPKDSYDKLDLIFFNFLILFRKIYYLFHYFGIVYVIYNIRNLY